MRYGGVSEAPPRSIVGDNNALGATLTIGQEKTLVDLLESWRPSQEKVAEDGHDRDIADSNVATFQLFNRRAKYIREQLTTFSNTISSIARRGAILHAATHLSDHLQVVLFLFRENAARLFPHKIKMREEKREYFHLRATLKYDQTGFTLEAIPAQLGFLAEAILEFHDRLTEIPELREPVTEARLVLFEQDLVYWQGYCETLKDRFQEYVVHVYLNELLGEMEVHLDNLSTMLTILCNVTLPRLDTAKCAQNDYLVALTAVATLFASIAATTLSLSYAQPRTLLWDFVNAFWFSSLVLSIVSVVISLIGLVWNEDLCLYPEQRFPRWISSSLRRLPMFLLVVAVLAFSAGLVLFGFSSNQHIATSSVTLGFTGVSVAILLALVIWFAIEDNRFKGNTERDATHTLFDRLLALINIFRGMRRGRRARYFLGMSRRIGAAMNFEKDGTNPPSQNVSQLSQPGHTTIGIREWKKHRVQWLYLSICRVIAMTVPPRDVPFFTDDLLHEDLEEVDIYMEDEAYDSASEDIRSNASHSVREIYSGFKGIVTHNIPLPYGSEAPSDIHFSSKGRYLASS
ncbi:hypothetical protein PUNSTDRAFT_143097, partial [Punctularia strigosozonata HHB-11173 SS5]|uniref:uncharacterized protein n=1 Tax=Punctularia strigosozonata (strain HHB-11173) TaxID=741275 RepID=UPI0004416AFE